MWHENRQNEQTNEGIERKYVKCASRVIRREFSNKCFQHI